MSVFEMHVAYSCLFRV